MPAVLSLRAAESTPPLGSIRAPETEASTPAAEKVTPMASWPWSTGSAKA
jgi:hypothetical protein